MRGLDWILIFSLLDETPSWQVCLYDVFLCVCVSEQKDQDEVRRRFASITYSDPLYWDRPDAAAGKNIEYFHILTNLKSLEIVYLILPVGGDNGMTDKSS